MLSYLQAEMIKGSETESREDRAVAGDGGEACEERDRKKNRLLQRSWKLLTGDKAALERQLQILNEAQFQLAVWFAGNFSYLSFHELLSFFDIISLF